MLQTKQHGFTFIEIAVVIVIITVLFSVIITGQGLLKNAQLQSLITQYRQYSDSIELFKDNYNQLPGDFNDAFAIWGTECAISAANCNGDGNGQIDFSTINLQANESWRAWQHMELADILQLSLQGNGSASQSIIDENVPGSIIGGGWEFRSYNSSTDRAYTALDFYDVATSAAQTPNMRLLSTIQLQEVDNKIDDGLPRRGNVMAMESSSDCYDDSSTPYVYNFANQVACGAQFVVVENAYHPVYE